MLDFNHYGISARGWDYLDVDPARFRGLMPMASYTTETPAPAMVAQILDAYDDAGRIAPDMVNFGTGAVGASVLELMVSAGDLYGQSPPPSHTHARAICCHRAGGDGRYDYYINEGGTAHWLDTHRHEPGLWDAMNGQIGFAASAAEIVGDDVHAQVAMSSITGRPTPP